MANKKETTGVLPSGFESEIAELIEKAFSTETFHYRRLNALDENITRSVDEVILVRNALGDEGLYPAASLDAALSAFYEDKIRPRGEGAVKTFYSSLLGEKKIGVGDETIAVFKNTEHSETVTYFMDRGLYSSRWGEIMKLYYFFVPIRHFLKTSSWGRTDLPLPLMPAPDFKFLPGELEPYAISALPKAGNVEEPSFCLFVDPDEANGVEGTVKILAQWVDHGGYFPILYGVRPNDDQNSPLGAENDQPYYHLTYGDWLENPDLGAMYENLADRMARPTAIRAALNYQGCRNLIYDRAGIVDWAGLNGLMNLWDMGFKTGQNEKY